MNIHEVRDVFVAVMEIVGEHTGGWEENQRPGGEGFGGIPNVGMEEGVGGGAELLDTEVVVVDETLEEAGGGGLGAHFDTAAHAVEGHRDDSIAGLPTNGAIFGVILHRPNAGLSFDEGLVAIRIILGRKVVDGGVLVEIVGGVGFALGGGAVSDVVVVVGNVIGGDQFVADVVAVLLVVLGGAAAEEVVGVGIRTNLCTIGVSIRDFSQ